MEEDVEIYDGVKEDASKASIHTNPNTENVRKLLWGISLNLVYIWIS